MSNLISTRSPLFWVIVGAGLILPALSRNVAVQAVATLLVVAFVVTGFVRARRRQRAVAEQR